jgi:hypothetical protein
MFTIIWDLNGFYVIDKLPNDTEMNSDYFVTNIFNPLEQAVFPRWRAPNQKRLVIYLDNCSIRTNQVLTNWLKEHSMCRMADLLYSLDLASSNFYLFHTVKRARTDSGGWRRLVFRVRAKDFQECRSKRIKRHISDLDAAGSRSKQRQGNGNDGKWSIIFIYIGYI